MTDFLELPPGWAWELSGNYDPTKFFEAFRLFAGTGVLTLYLEGTSIGIREELRPFETEAPGRIRPGTTWPESPKLHLRLTTGLIDRLVAISNTNAVPDYADHVVLYGDAVIVDAYDFAEIPFHIAGDVDEQAVQEFARIVGSTYRLVTV